MAFCRSDLRSDTHWHRLLPRWTNSRHYGHKIPVRHLEDGDIGVETACWSPPLLWFTHRRQSGSWKLEMWLLASDQQYTEKHYSSMPKGLRHHSSPLARQGTPWRTREWTGWLVDELARLALEKTPLHELTDWIQTITNREVSQALEWAWILYDPHYMQHCNEGIIYLPRGPSTTPTVENISVLNSIAPQESDAEEEGELDLHICSYNAMTLKEAQTDRIDSPSKMECLLRQLHEEGVHIFGIQETRISTTRRALDRRYHLVNSAATTGGHAGILIGIAKDRPIGKDSKGKALYIQDKDIGILHSDPRRLALRISSPALKCIILSCHAPHTGQAKNEIEAWWTETETCIPSHHRDWPLLLLADANARTGQHPSKHIGDHAAEEGGEKAEPFEDFVAAADLLLPSTFTDYHQGESATWAHSQGRLSRIDYIGIPLQWQATRIESWVQKDFDTPLPRDDHFPAHAKIAFGTVSNRKRKRSTARPLTIAGIIPDLTPVANAPQCSWETDVHQHAEILQQQVAQCLQKQQPQPQEVPLRTTMAPSTWALVQEKRNWRQQLAEANRTQALGLLRTCFATWATGAAYDTNQQQQIQRIQREQDQLVATALQRFRQLGRAVTAAMRKDDVAFYQGLLQDCAEFTSPAQAKQLWATLRRSLPKMKNRRRTTPPLKNLVLEDQWIPYLCQLETGETCLPDQLLRQCLRPLPQRELADTLEIQQLPSLHRLEAVFRATTPGKSTGLDPLPAGLFHTQAPILAHNFFSLLLKTYLWADEPVQYKGGKMTMLHKKGPTSDVTNYRGIMLLATASKRFHALMRQDLEKAMSHSRPQGQLGGFSGQQTSFGAQALRTYGNVARGANKSCAVLFIDIQYAFHRLPRELAVGVLHEEEWHKVLLALAEAGTPLEAQAAGQSFVDVLDKLQVPPLLRQVLRSAHSNTWFTLTGGEIIRTARGTRPGSPIADIIFHLIMYDAMEELDRWIHQQSDYQQLLANLSLDYTSIIWADDVAVPWMTDHAEKLIPALEELIKTVHQIFTKRGLPLNYAVGKTNAVLTFRGPRAPEMRQRYQLTNQESLCRSATQTKSSCRLYCNTNTLGQCTHQPKLWTLRSDIALAQQGVPSSKSQRPSWPTSTSRRRPESECSRSWSALGSFMV